MTLRLFILVSVCADILSPYLNFLKLICAVDLCHCLRILVLVCADILFPYLCFLTLICAATFCLCLCILVLDRVAFHPLCCLILLPVAMPSLSLYVLIF